MKKIILSLTIVLAISISSFAQDVIYKTDGTEIKGMVIEITKDVIKYYKFTQQSGPIRKIDISEVFIVIYEDGSQEVFKKNEQSQDRIQSTPLSKEVETPSKTITQPKATEASASQYPTTVVTNATPIQDNGIDPKTPVVKEEIKPSWGVSAAYTRFIFASETSKSVYSSLNGFEAKVFYREKRSELGVFCVNQYGDGDPIEYGNVPPGATSHMRFFLIGLDSKVFVGKIFYFSLRTGYATVKESLTAMNQTGSASIDEWLLSPGVGLDIPTGDKFGLSAHVRYENFWVPALNGWNFGGGIFIKF